MAVVFVPVALRKLTGDVARLHMPGATLRELIANLETRFPGMQTQLTEGDRLKPGLAAVIDGEATVNGLRTKLRDDSEVHFLPAIAGGASRHMR